ncbi:hypothetical protein FXO38_19039 [Capsicum annuum]|nr:hypothetical protein FXO38_19039 [Capsicum annuum]
MEGDDIVRDVSEFVRDTHNVSLMLKPFDNPPKFDGTPITHVAQTLNDGSKTKSYDLPLSVKHRDLKYPKDQYEILVLMVKFEKWLYLFNQSVSNLHLSEVIEFYTEMEYHTTNNSVFSHVFGVKIYLYEKVLREVLVGDQFPIEKSVFKEVLGNCKQARRRQKDTEIAKLKATLQKVDSLKTENIKLKADNARLETKVADLIEKFLKDHDDSAERIVLLLKSLPKPSLKSIIFVALP